MTDVDLTSPASFAAGHPVAMYDLLPANDRVHRHETAEGFL